MDSFSFLSNTDTNSIDSLYNQYKKDPSSVDISWARFFEGFDFQKSEYAVLPGGDAISGAGAEALQKEFKVINLVYQNKPCS
jgi:2-oxoglutarate dehydrogenase E1 component